MARPLQARLWLTYDHATCWLCSVQDAIETKTFQDNLERTNARRAFRLFSNVYPSDTSSSDSCHTSPSTVEDDTLPLVNMAATQTTSSRTSISNSSYSSSISYLFLCSLMYLRSTPWWWKMAFNVSVFNPHPVNIYITYCTFVNNSSPIGKSILLLTWLQ